jgi:transposase-like protein
MQCTYSGCGSDRYTKNGFSGYARMDGTTNRKQRYRCKECMRNYTLPTVEDGIAQKWGISDDTRLRVLSLYHLPRKKKLSYRKTAELINKTLPKGARKVSYSTVRNWVLQSEGFELDKERLAKQKPASYTEDDAGYII